MFCTVCRHNLRGIAPNKCCPECGQPFEQSDPSTFRNTPSRFASSPPNQIGRLGWTTMLLALLPGCSIGLLILSWLAGWTQLGHQPVPMVDDPKGIPGRFFGVMYVLGILGLISFFPAIALTAVVLGIQTGRALLDRRRWKSWAVVAGTSVVLMGTAWWTVSGALPGRIIEWLLD